MAKESIVRSRQISINGQGKVPDSSFEVRQSCLEKVDDIYCHYYFKRCYIDSRPQRLCREACEELIFKLCEREFKFVLDFNKARRKINFPLFWEIINCTTLPFRNSKSSNCYFPDKIRGWCSKRRK